MAKILGLFPVGKLLLSEVSLIPPPFIFPPYNFKGDMYSVYQFV